MLRPSGTKGHQSQGERARSAATELEANGLTREDLEIDRSIRQRRLFTGDMYEHVAEAELALHDMVRTVLVEEFGDGDSGYWRQGIPVSIRKHCQDRREDDTEPCKSAFQYTTLIDLAEIIRKNWAVFRPVLPKKDADNQREVARDLDRLNIIRNTVMHPVKRRRWTDDDFEFVREIRLAFEQFRVT
jgi:hypothetical protein